MHPAHNDDITLINDFFDQEIIDWCIWYYNQFPEHRFNNIKFIQETHWDRPFNRWFGNLLQTKISQFFPLARLHSAYIGNDVRCGGVHTDGWIYEGEIDLAYKTILVPLKFNVPSATVIFNESNPRGMTLNAVTGLGTDGIDAMQQSPVVDPNTPFCLEDHRRWLSHLNIQGLAGLTVCRVLDWVPGRAMSWSRARWHGPARFQENSVERYHLTIMTQT
jgi:hypothetical protein